MLREEAWILSGEEALRELLNLLSSAKERIEFFPLGSFFFLFTGF